MSAILLIDTLVVIAHVSVLPMDRERLLLDQTVVIRGERIAAVGPSGRTPIPSGSLLIDGAGLTLLPGLADMHVHITPADFPALLVNGVTLVRELNGSPDHLRWRAEVDRGERIGPRMIVSSPLLAGTPQRWRHALVTSDSAAVRVVEDIARAGYDFVKTYDGLSASVYATLVREAKAHGLRVTGHIPADVGLAGVISQRPNSIEHARMMLESVGGHDADSAAALRAADMLAGSGVWIVPTLAAYEALDLMRTRGMQARLNSPEMAYVDSAMRGWWMSFRVESPADSATPRQRRRVELTRLLVARAAAGGTGILAGTDTPNPLMIPGFSLHDELASLEAAGLTRYQVLAAATSKAAEFMGWEKESGTVAAGKRADLLLVRGNPLEDLRALRNVEGVVLRGRWLSRDQLGAMLVKQ